MSHLCVSQAGLTAIALSNVRDLLSGKTDNPALSASCVLELKSSVWVFQVLVPLASEKSSMPLLHDCSRFHCKAALCSQTFPHLDLC